MSKVSFKSTEKELELISSIANRVEKMEYKEGYMRMDLIMDLMAINANDVSLDFQKLLDFDDFNFGHDVFGIRRHINRLTGTLQDCFLPKCSKQP